jgi:cystathionine beta-lyase/cystathionine gamma-synthase
LSDEQRGWTDIGPGTTRLSIGIEDGDDLLDDLRQALERI